MGSDVSPGSVINILIVGFSFCYLMGFAGIAFPIWMIVDCLKRKNKSPWFGFCWLLFIGATVFLGFLGKIITFCLAGLGATAYGFLASDKKIIRVVSILNIAVVITFVFSTNLLEFFNVEKVTNATIPSVQSEIRNMSGTLPQSTQGELIKALDHLKDEIKEDKIFIFPLIRKNEPSKNRKLNDVALVVLANMELERKIFTASEASEWLEYFKKRQTLDLKVLKQKMNSLGRKGAFKDN